MEIYSFLNFETVVREEMLREKTQVHCILWNIFIETLKLLNMREWLILSKINRPITTQVNKKYKVRQTP